MRLGTRFMVAKIMQYNVCTDLVALQHVKIKLSQHLFRITLMWYDR